MADSTSGDASALAQTLAQRCAEAMWSGDHATRGLGMDLLEVGPGRAVIGMTIRESMANGQGNCHGGFIFALADSAFAFACNSHGPMTVAQHCSVTFLRPGRVGDRLTAQAVERTRAGRSGIYDVSITRADGALIAEFRGHSRTVEGSWVDDPK
ncbi:MAG TPA: hydroxyphenylacetyl-CoA thioesterase PaaI [Hyphomicrobiaceae bacterium]|nr:hydroxyphenylacetyl-CoA thioesterase PaaI [Hyphomicrobiaceae bacterium]